jgi:uncharacterized UPF0160 family protein
MNPKFKKIIVHGGVFHADELLAIATLKQLGVVEWHDVVIERQNKVDITNIPCDVIIMDIGGVNNGVNIFDHHQDKDLPAACVLVLDAFCENKELAEVLKKHFYNAVSDIDTGKIFSTPATFSQIVGNFNLLEDGFNKALAYVQQTLDVVWNMALKSLESKKKWSSLETICNGRVKIQNDTDFIPNWKEMAEEEGVKALISPNLREGWQIISWNSNDFVIPVKEGQTFIHSTGFMAVYINKEAVIEHAKELLS